MMLEQSRVRATAQLKVRTLRRGLCESHAILAYRTVWGAQIYFCCGATTFKREILSPRAQETPFPAIGQSEFHLVEQP